MSTNNLDHTAFSLFKIFAQYESSLKEHGYFQSVNGQKIIVDWDRFVNEKIGQNFLELLEDNEQSAIYILENPPKKQIVNEDNEIVWQDVSNHERSIQALFGHISRVRNNLFHGAKFNGTWFDPERSELLMEHSLIILRHFKSKVELSS